MTHRSFEEIKARCGFILDDKNVVFLVEKSSSPSAAFQMIFTETGDTTKAKAGRWLAVMKRDYPDQFRSLL